MSWTSPTVICELVAGVLLLGVFAVIETRVSEPMIDLRLLRIRAFTGGNVATRLTAMARGGLQFTLVVWLQGVWLPKHGYDFAETPLWAGIHMLPLIAGILIAGPISGYLSDRYGGRPFATLGPIISAVSFLLLLQLPVDFPYAVLAAILLLNGIGTGLFVAPNRASVMNSLPPAQRGVGGAMTTTFQNSGQVLSIGIFFSLLVIGLSAHLPDALHRGFVAGGVPDAAATQAAHLPPVTTLFATFLGYNPVQALLGDGTLAALAPAQAAHLTSRTFFPELLSGPFSDGLTTAFTFAFIACCLAAAASWMRGGRYVWSEPAEPVEAMPASDGGLEPAPLATSAND